MPSPKENFPAAKSRLPFPVQKAVGGFGGREAPHQQNKIESVAGGLSDHDTSTRALS